MSKKYYQEHKEEIRLIHFKRKLLTKEYDRQRYLKNKEKIKAQTKKYKLEHKEEIKEKTKNYVKKNNLQINCRDRNRMKTDLSFKIKKYLRSRLYYAVKGVCKSKHTLELLGCSVEFLKLYLASKFTPGMTWENYGKWHIDHIRPCASFDLSREEELYKCFNYTNLQPLWAKDNQYKSDKLGKEAI